MDPFCHNRRYRYINTFVFSFPLLCRTFRLDSNEKRNNRTNIQSVNPLSSTNHIVPPISPIRNEDSIVIQSSFPKTDNYTANVRRTYVKQRIFTSSLKCDFKVRKNCRKNTFYKRFVIRKSKSIKKLCSHNSMRSSPRPISIGQLHALLRFHLRPINLVVCKGSYYLTIWDILS